MEETAYRNVVSPLENIKKEIMSCPKIDFPFLRKIIEKYAILKFFPSISDLPDFYSLKGFISRERKRFVKIFFKTFLTSLPPAVKEFNEDNVYVRGKKIFLDF